MNDIQLTKQLEKLRLAIEKTPRISEQISEFIVHIKNKPLPGKGYCAIGYCGKPDTEQIYIEIERKIQWVRVCAEHAKAITDVISGEYEIEKEYERIKNEGLDLSI